MKPLETVDAVLGAGALACTEAKAAGGDSVRVYVPAGTYEEQYALREKQDKTPTGAGIEVANGDYTYAPKTGTCVQLRGDIRY